MKRKEKSNNNTLPPNKINTAYQQPNSENVNNKKKLKISNNKDNNPDVPTYENHRHFIIDTSNVGKTYYMLKKLEKIGNQIPIHIIARSPKQNPSFKKVIKLNQYINTKGQLYFSMIC